MSTGADNAQIAIDDTYAEYGHAALYQAIAGGEPKQVTVILDLRDPNSRIDDGRPVSGTALLEVRTTDVAAPANGDTFQPGEIVNGTFVPGPRTLTVSNRPMIDEEEGLVWKMWAV
jgi:hypothetical protein